jgi:hypothetical protein
MTPERQHPLESVYQARDALQEAYSIQLKADLTKQDLPAYGWALQDVLNSLGELARVLAHQIDQIDRDRLYRAALQDHPYEVIDYAVEHMNRLRHALEVATRDAEGYQSKAEVVDRTTRDSDENGPVG